MYFEWILQPDTARYLGNHIPFHCKSASYNYEIDAELYRPDWAPYFKTTHTNHKTFYIYLNKLDLWKSDGSWFQ